MCFAKFVWTYKFNDTINLLNSNYIVTCKTSCLNHESIIYFLYVIKPVLRELFGESVCVFLESIFMRLVCIHNSMDENETHRGV